MHDVLAFLKDIDLGGHALNILDLIQRADICFVGLIVCVLISLGYKMVSGQKAVFSWGLRIAVFTMLVHFGVSWAYADEVDGRMLGILAARAAVFGGAELALIWIFFPILVFIYTHLRLALTGFLLYGGYAIIVSGGDFKMDQLPGIAMRSGVAAALAIIIAWIFQPLWDLLVRRFGKPKTEEKKPEAPGVSDELARLERKHRRAMMKKKIRRQMQQEQDRDSLDDGEEVHTMQVEMRRRRDKARLTVELTYAMTMSEMTNQLPRDMFESWISRYLGDHLPPEDVEENSKQLQTILAQQKKIAQQLNTNGSGNQLEDLNHWFLEEQRRIQSDTSLDQAEKQKKLLDLQQMYTSLVNRVLGEQQSAVVPLPYRPGTSQGEINAM